MKKCVLIEYLNDLSLLNNSEVDCHDTVFLTPSVAVAQELEKRRCKVETLSPRREWFHEVISLEENTRYKTLRLRHEIVEYLNALGDYRFKGYHHPDYSIYYLKAMLFAIEYCCFMLNKLLKSCAGDLSNIVVYVVDDSQRMNERLEVGVPFVEDKFFPQGQRRFTNVLMWKNPDIIHKLCVLDKQSDSASLQRARQIGPYIREKTINLYTYLLSKCNELLKTKIGRERPVTLYDLTYIESNSLYNVIGCRMHGMQRHIADNSFMRFKKNKHVSENTKKYVDIVECNVLNKLYHEGFFEIDDFNYYSKIKATLRVFIEDEISSLYWAECEASKLTKKFNLASVHSDVAYYTTNYSLFRILNDDYKIPTYSYPHGAEGYYDYFWQERYTTAATSSRIVQTDDQKKHFEEQQNKYYSENYHTKYIIHPMSFKVKNISKSSFKQYDILYVMSAAPVNMLHTIINYPISFDLYRAQKYILDTLIKAASVRKMSLCVRPSSSEDEELFPYMFKNLNDDVSVSYDKKFMELLPLSKMVLTDSATTVLFQGMEYKKKILCINCFNKANDSLVKVMNDSGVVYVEYDAIKGIDIPQMISNFLAS